MAEDEKARGFCHKKQTAVTFGDEDGKISKSQKVKPQKSEITLLTTMLLNPLVHFVCRLQILTIVDPNFIQDSICFFLGRSFKVAVISDY